MNFQKSNFLVDPVFLGTLKGVGIMCPCTQATFRSPVLQGLIFNYTKNQPLSVLHKWYCNHTLLMMIKSSWFDALCSYLQHYGPQFSHSSIFFLGLCVPCCQNCYLDCKYNLLSHYVNTNFSSEVGSQRTQILLLDVRCVRNRKWDFNNWMNFSKPLPVGQRLS